MHQWLILELQSISLDRLRLCHIYWVGRVRLIHMHRLNRLKLIHSKVLRVVIRIRRIDAGQPSCVSFVLDLVFEVVIKDRRHSRVQLYGLGVVR